MCLLHYCTASLFASWQRFREDWQHSRAALSLQSVLIALHGVLALSHFLLLNNSNGLPSFHTILSVHAFFTHSFRRTSARRQFPQGSLPVVNATRGNFTSLRFIAFHYTSRGYSYRVGFGGVCIGGVDIGSSSGPPHGMEALPQRV